MMALHARAFTGLVIGTLLGTCAFLACKSDPEPETEPTVIPGVTAPEPLFRAIEDDLKTTCGGANGSCHVRGSQAPHWLGDPDAYLSAKKYPGILPATHEPGDSTLLTQVDHVGPSLKRYPKLYDRVGAWLNAELPPPPLPSSNKFSVINGFNQVNLNTLASNLDGARMTFLASEVSVGTLSLTAIRIYAPQNANLQVESPFFVVLPRNGKVKAEPSVNGFAGELTVPAGTSKDFYTGKMILTRWDNAGQMKVAFTKISSTPGMGASEGCRALDVFTSKALPAMRTELDITGDDDNDGGTFDGSVIGKGSCLGCHGKATPSDEAPSTAVSAMDLRAADSNPAIACGFARNFISFENRPQSLILTNPQGKANPFHPIVPLSADDPIIKGIAEWVNAEQP
jgi:hypothetical protein